MAAGYLFLNLYLLLKQVLLQFVIVLCMHVDENYSGFTGPCDTCDKLSRDQHGQWY